MVLTKVWLQGKLDYHIKEKEVHQKNNDTLEFNKELGYVLAYREVLAKQSEAPIPKSDQPKKAIDVDKGYESIVKYYMGKGKTKEEANKIAQKTLQDQMQQRLQ